MKDDYISIQCPSCGVSREYYTGLFIQSKRWCPTCNITFDDSGILQFYPPKWEPAPVTVYGPNGTEIKLEEKPQKDRLILI